MELDDVQREFFCAEFQRSETTFQWRNDRNHSNGEGVRIPRFCDVAQIII